MNAGDFGIVFSAYWASMFLYFLLHELHRWAGGRSRLD